MLSISSITNPLSFSISMAEAKLRLVLLHFRQGSFLHTIVSHANMCPFLCNECLHDLFWKVCCCYWSKQRDRIWDCKRAGLKWSQGGAHSKRWGQRPWSHWEIERVWSLWFGDFHQLDVTDSANIVSLVVCQDTVWETWYLGKKACWYNTEYSHQWNSFSVS